MGVAGEVNTPAQPSHDGFPTQEFKRDTPSPPFPLLTSYDPLLSPLQQRGKNRLAREYFSTRH